MRSTEDIELGREVVRTGRLQELRGRLGLTRNAMADFLHTSYPTYTSWENRATINLWPATASRVGRFYRVALEELRLMEEAGFPLGELIPFRAAATQLGLPQELFLRMYRDGEVEAVDAGILGLWLDASELDRLRSRYEAG